MIDPLYTERLLDAAAALPPARRLPTPDASATRVSRVCGSEVTVDLALDGDRIVDIALEARACAIGQAAASIFAAAAVGARAAEVFALRGRLRAFVRGDGPAPAGRWVRFESLAAVQAYPQRHASARLAVEAAAEALEARGFSPDGRWELGETVTEHSS